MARRADSFAFRAQAAQLNWGAIVQRLRGGQPGRFDPFAIDPKLLRLHSMDIHLTWACSADLGVPRGPFTVWTRERREDKLEKVDVALNWRGQGIGLWWGGVEASCVDVVCDVVDPAKPVGLFLLRTAPNVNDTVAATAVPAGGGATVSIRLRAPGATTAVLVNGRNPVARIERLADVVNDDAWKPLEVVGLPVDQPWSGTLYDTSDQGPVAAPVDPVEAAVIRLVRGGPIAGWGPVTQTGHPAPPWVAPDPKLLVEEVRKTLLPELMQLYDGSAREYQQAAIVNSRTVPGPQSGTRTSSLDATADAGPWPMLMLPAMSDPFLNLATGFGSSYTVEPLDPSQIAVGGSDFLVTALYENLKPPNKGPVEMAAYSPSSTRHTTVADPTGLIAARSGLVAPAAPNQAWRESVRVGWDRLASPASIGGVTESSVARFDVAAGSPAQTLLPMRDSGGLRPLAITPDAADGQPGHDRASVSDGAAEIPLGSGGRHVGYAVAVSDIYGVWSSWRDAVYDSTEPAPQPPRVVSVELTARYAGSPSCPAELDTEIAVEWLERTPTVVDVAALFFPMASPTSAPPAGLSPTAPTPAGCFRRDFGLTFAGDVPTGVGCDVLNLDPTGEHPMAPGTGQGDGGRRYALHLDVPLLDFGTTRRWGVQLFARRSLPVAPSPSGWAPDPAHPAVTSAASPVPVAPLPPPAPPGVPLGSTPDADGRSHVRVHWSLPAGADVRTVVVWEASEASIRQRRGLPTQSADAPGVRLATLWSQYDAMTDTQRRNAFRRIRELPGTAREVDVTLPKGSTDIHLFVVTTVTTSGVDSPWPGGGSPHTHLQAVTAPRLRRPAPPLPRAGVATDGTVTIALQAASAVPVRAFRLLRTRSEVAARSADTMGPAFAEVVADAVPAATDAVTGADIPATDPVTGRPVYTATWTGTFPASWDEWLVRAVALAVDTVPVQAVRGLPSDASDALAVLVPPAGPPDLAPLTSALTSGDGAGVVVRSSTSAPARATVTGSHRLLAIAGSQVASATPLQDLPETPLATPPPAAAAGAVLERAARSAGRSPLGLWFTRAVPADPVDVTVRLVDPLGRASERTITVPGFTPPPPVQLSIVRTTAIAGRGVSVEVLCDADPAAAPPFVLQVRAVQRRPFPGGGFPPLLPRTLTASFPFDTIPDDLLPPLPANRIQVVRHRLAAPGQGNYGLWVPLTAPVTVTVSVMAPDGGRVTVTADG